MHTQIQASDDLTEVSTLKNKEEEKMHDVLLLLENLSCREEASIIAIIDCLYDIGYVNLINQKFRSRTLNGSLKLIARLSKPAFKIIAWRWYKSNCPKLIVKWLRKQVSFEPKTKIKQAAEIQAAPKPEPSKPLDSAYLVKLENQNHEVKYLRSQVRMLTSIVIALTAVFGGSVLWFASSERSNFQNVQQKQNKIRVLETSNDEPLANGKGN
ncbi:hypothetical protein NIES267_32320 [Calothrix parasitica NIES-267]|uniref:Uncharacterized protein n=1 Tax=Calothrix parasitica NIES-267 TaxID=1973488 RepID=A0A1Z4LRE9_9CYAN|nr:hypothetical protein NIES267_32320 [Calothrix parasitica NIES-267]